MVIISMPRTWLVVTPCSSLWGPPELMATFPPVVQADWFDGSGRHRGHGLGLLRWCWKAPPLRRLPVHLINPERVLFGLHFIGE